MRLFVFIYLPNETVATPAGIFDHDSQLNAGHFNYGHRYRINKNSYPLSPIELPFDRSPFFTRENNGLFSVFRDAAPDYWGRTVFSASINKTIDEIEDCEYLLYGGASRTGNLDFRLSVNAPEPQLELPSYTSLEDLLNAADLIQAGLPVDRSLALLLNQGSSGIGGMRPKCTVAGDNKVLWLAKFPDKSDRYNAVKIEYATMMLAEKAGITIPELKLVTINDKDVLLIRRFDREYNDEKQGYMRKGFLSSLSLLQKHETDRDFGYPEIAEKLRLMGVKKDAQAIFDRMVFNIACRNTDDHARNHGFLIDGNDISLSPAYDINPTRSTPGISTDYYLALKIGDRDRLAELDNALSQCSRFGLTRDQAMTKIEMVRSALIDWQSVFDQCGIDQKDRDLFANTFEVSIERFDAFLNEAKTQDDQATNDAVLLGINH